LSRSSNPFPWVEARELRVIPPYTIDVTFADGTQRRIDMESELWGEVFEPLRNPEVFAQAKLNPTFGSVCWPTGADLAPEFLYYGDEGPPPDYFGLRPDIEGDEEQPQAPAQKQ
jgi:hypothetical protein